MENYHWSNQGSGVFDEGIRAQSLSILVAFGQCKRIAHQVLFFGDFHEIVQCSISKVQCVRPFLYLHKISIENFILF